MLMKDLSQGKCDEMVKIKNSFVLNVADFGAIVDVVLAIPALLGDGVGVPFPGGWDYLYFNPDSKDVCHIGGINNRSHTGAIQWLLIGSYSITKILQLFFLNSVSLFNE